VRDIRRATRKRHSPEEKIRIVLSGLGGEERTAGVADRRLHHASGAGYCA
jgi:transposase